MLKYIFQFYRDMLHNPFFVPINFSLSMLLSMIYSSSIKMKTSLCTSPIGGNSIGDEWLLVLDAVYTRMT